MLRARSVSVASCGASEQSSRKEKKRERKSELLEKDYSEKMSSPCGQCFWLGCRCSDGAIGSSTTQSTEAIERHREIHRTQNRFIEEGLDKNATVEGDQSMNHDGMMDQQNGVANRGNMANGSIKMEVKTEDGDSTTGQKEMEQDSREIPELGEVAKDEGKTDGAATNGRQETEQTSNKSGRYFPARRDNLAKIRQQLCWRLIRNRDRIRCRQCSDKISLERYSSAPLIIREHILSGKHSSKPVYGCRLCGIDCYNYSSLAQHFRRTHKGVSMINNYDNRGNNYHEEIVRELRACFEKGCSTNGGSAGGGSSRRKYRRREETVATMNVYRTRLSNARNPITNNSQPIVKNPCSIDQRIRACNDLIKKYPEGELIDCHKCKIFIEPQPDEILAHVESDLEGASSEHRCRHCDHRCLKESSMEAHLREFHKMERFELQYEADLDTGFMKLLRKCFGRQIYSKD